MFQVQELPTTAWLAKLPHRCRMPLSRRLRPFRKGRRGHRSLMHSWRATGQDGLPAERFYRECQLLLIRRKARRECARLRLAKMRKKGLQRVPDSEVRWYHRRISLEERRQAQEARPRGEPRNPRIR